LKSANDKYGHEEGDKLIRTAANLIGDSFGGKGGFFGRWGGDEFVAVFTEQKEFENFRSALHRGISDINKNTDLKDGFSISDGYVIHEPGQKDSVESLINIADKNMYYYKKKRKKAREE
jgi:diguanylate cyclase (GGDEF)-like protein